MQKSDFVVDLTKIEGDGEFPCPKCNVLISPDDDSDKIYKIVDTNFEGEDRFVLLQCICGARIRVIGFPDFVEVRR